jgi:hypothetical protein
MTQPNHTDLSRDMGRVEASLEALEGIVRQGFQDIKDELKDIKTDVEALKAAENKRKGAVAMLVAFGGVIGGLVVKFGAVVFGGQP